MSDLEREMERTREINRELANEYLGKLQAVLDKYGIKSPEELEQRLIEYGAI